ncbi:unnamed protein product [Rotaria magnacalcarata]|nr:unnamed protein product [Rotaria magnacalcarata]CAF1662141.1 unnamed protein product [Rotaria magnacalcarata]CAF2240730.1 unnamed protein product [Rotaria magnacalcarata]CAF3945968.1 unnamed protein product [Rotaria magnacalcarata]CAF3954025.1 unnamed protein product [Rotaria magnacalcarata]
MTSGVDPSACSCYPGSYHYVLCNKIKWSTLSICTALLMIIVYLSSGLYTLIDVTTMISMQSYDDTKYTTLWLIVSSSMMIFLDSISILIYFAIVILITILLCGIQLGKPWLLLVWSFIMIFMLLADGIVTLLSLREHQQQNYRSITQIKILYFVMIIRLIVSLCAIFVTVFHFRRVNKAQSEQMDRQRMLDRYNSEASSLSYYDSWAHSATFLNPSKDSIDDQYALNIPPRISLPRAKFDTLQHHSTSTMIDSHNQHSTNITQSHQRAIKRYADDFRYNIPIQERFHQQQ